MLLHHRIDLVFDVGANVGQFATALRGAGYRGRIVSFEPLASAHRDLLTSSRGDPDWEIAPRQAIGSDTGKVELHIAGNSVSSSMLGMLSSHSDAAPGSAYVGTEVVELTTLDQVAPLYIGTAARSFLKIDTQGTEDRVLDGAVKQLQRTHGVQLELSLLPLYEGQNLFDELDARLRALGFHRWAIEPVFSDGHTGRMLQVDGTYFRN
jgi:FkbM family methyltransferase